MLFITKIMGQSTSATSTTSTTTTTTATITSTPLTPMFTSSSSPTTSAMILTSNHRNDSPSSSPQQHQIQSSSPSSTTSSTILIVKIFDFIKNDYHVFKFVDHCNGIESSNAAPLITLISDNNDNVADHQQELKRLIYVEDLIYYLTIHKLSLTTICSPLFCLYDESADVWLSNDQKLLKLIDEFGLNSNDNHNNATNNGTTNDYNVNINNCDNNNNNGDNATSTNMNNNNINNNIKIFKFQLRIRYLHSLLLNKLKDIDIQSFNYYFEQIRYDFLNLNRSNLNNLNSNNPNKRRRKYNENILNNIYGIAIMDMVRATLADQQLLQQSRQNLSKYIDKYFYRNHYPRYLKKSKLLFIKNKLKDSFGRIFNENLNPIWIKYCYMKQFQMNMAEFYQLTMATEPNSFSEIYDIYYETLLQSSTNSSAITNDIGSHQSLVKYLLYFDWKDQKIYWKKSSPIDMNINNNGKHHPQNQQSTDDCWKIWFPLSEMTNINILSTNYMMKMTDYHRNCIKILICFINRPAITIIFTDRMKMKSFITLLFGYHRLSRCWNLNLSTKQLIHSPMLSRMKQINCFGCLNNSFVLKKMAQMSDGQRNSGLFLLKQSLHNFYELNLCYEQHEQLKMINLKWSPSTLVITGEDDNDPDGNEFESIFTILNNDHTDPTDADRMKFNYQELLLYLQKYYNLYQPMLLQENDYLPDLLLCNGSDESITANNDNNNNMDYTRTISSIKSSSDIQNDNNILPIIIKNDCIKKSILTIQNNGIFCTRIGQIINSNDPNPNQSTLINDKIYIKEFLDNSKIKMDVILKDIDEWIKLKNVSILNIKGICMHPLSILSEYCHITLRNYYQLELAKSLNVLQLTEAIFCLAKAIDYLFIQNIRHGYIRFDNLFVSHFSRQSLFIKLGDPIGHQQLLLLSSSSSASTSTSSNHNVNNDQLLQQQQPWLPPEYFNVNGFFYKKITSYSDVWSFATTIWEIFNNGERPFFNYQTIMSNERQIIDARKIPENIRLLMRKCWNQNFCNRITPSGIFRDMVTILYDTRKYRFKLQQQQHQQHPNYHQRPSLLSSLSSSSNVPYNSNKQINNIRLTNYRKNYQYLKSLNINGGDDNRNVNNQTSSAASSSSILPLSNGYQQRPSSLMYDDDHDDDDDDDYDDDDYDDDDTTQTTLYDQMEDAFLITENDDYLHQQAMDNLEFIEQNRITKLEVIGVGNYGKVYKARCDDEFVALKILSDNKSTNLSEEIKILAKLRHRNIVEIRGYSNVDVDHFSKGSSKALIMEYMPYGSLVKFLETKQPSDNLEMTKFALDIACGLDFLASKHIIHRDLAARNILVASINSVKIADFGLAHILEDDQQYQYRSSRGLPYKWHAPESFERNLFRFESDIWSYGIVLWEMYSYCRQTLYKEIDSNKDDAQELLRYLKQGKRLECPENCPTEIYKLMNDCWQYQPELRPNSSEILSRIRRIDERIRLR